MILKTSIVTAIMALSFAACGSKSVEDATPIQQEIQTETQPIAMEEAPKPVVHEEKTSKKSKKKSKKKMAQSDAKKSCLEESPHLAGKELRKCIRAKLK